ncbi:hypothetical protein B0T17DRAFT_480178, partial [Bombardia bombarda]
MANTMIPQHYAPQQNVHYGYVPPPSPPMDETKCSLPSISNLLGLADQGSPTSETSPHSQQQCGNSRGNKPKQSMLTVYPAQTSSKTETRPDSSHYGNPAMARTALPPSPPMSSDASFEGYNSPSTKSVSQLSNSSQYYFETTPPLSQMEAEARHMASVMPRVPVQPSTYQPGGGYTTSYMSPPAMATYYPPMQPAPPQHSQIPGLYYQRPLPQVFPPMAVSINMGPASGANPWQHHHFIAPSSTSSYPQSQDRYICQTCSKAFSRPSSLRIHSHSHTGEKPFKCQHAGCGKAFSVRSNMKRHERGCHKFESSSS